MVRKRNPRILVFDSGLGGLSVLRALVKTMPFADYVFLADDARFPYGDLADEDLIDGLVTLVEEACLVKSPDLLVVACNTASTIALGALRHRFAFPIVGIVPAIKPAANATQTGAFSVLATPGTIRRSYTRDLITEFAGDCDVSLIACTGLARLAEDYLLQGLSDMEAIRKEIAPAFSGEHGEQADVIVLGCTHYPLLLPVLEGVAPRSVLWIDPAHAVARRVMHLLGQEWQDCIVSTTPGQEDRSGYCEFTATSGGADRLRRAWDALSHMVR
ncbi:glutamate racemase [uncultured Cohaesibacter sp.]|uniref:glutamate racemase n=1 Tax=uncultured Cohaesibacter sp. TaxID=1002546 RepID=UPI00292F9244|nr:glutamate racemase [uncultured Cohaesibacter sp.]